MIKKLLKRKSLVNSLIYIFADVLNKAIPFLLLPIFTKYLTPSDYGIVTVFTSLTALLTVFIGLSTQNAIYVNYFQYTKEKMQIYIANILFLIMMSTIFALSIVFLFDTYISQWLELPKLWLYLAVVYIFAQTISSILSILWMVEEKAVSFGIFQILNTLLLFILALVFIVGYKLTWVGQLSAMLITSILFAIFSLFILFKNIYLKFSYSKESLKDALYFGIPLIPHKLGEWLKLSADKFLLVALIGSSATGLYAVGYQIASIIIIISIAVQKAWQPYLFRQLNHITSIQDKIRLVKLTYSIFFLIVIFSISLYTISPYIISYFLDERFIGAASFIGYLILANFFAAMNHTVIGYIYYTKKTIMLVRITIITALMHIGLSYFLIIQNGIIGAAQASSISFATTFIMVWHMSNKLYPMPWNIFKSETS